MTLTRTALVVASIVCCVVNSARGESKTDLLLPPEIGVYASEDGSIQQRLVSLIDSAKVEILVNQHCFTNPELARALVRAQRDHKVLVYVLLEPEPGLKSYPTPNALSAAGIEVRLSQPAGTNNNRYMIIDSELTVVGSYVWTLTSERHSSETIIVIRNPALAAKMIENFRRSMAAAIEIITAPPLLEPIQPKS